MTSFYKALVAQEILRSRLISAPFQILYPGAISLSPMRWDNMFGPDDAVVHAFEPDTDRGDRVDPRLESRHPTHRYYDHVLWSDESEVTLHVNETMGASSLFPHDFATVDRWVPMGLGRDIHEIRCRATTVAEWAKREGIDDLDFARLNVEGAELAVLQGMGALLDNILAAVVEVNFLSNYLSGAPVFSDVDAYLRARGFTFFGFVDNAVCVGRKACPLTDVQRSAYFPVGSRGRQMIQEHALYLRDPISEFSKISDSPFWTNDRILKLAFWADLHGQTDFAFELLAWLRDGTDDPNLRTGLRQLIDAAARRFEGFAESETFGDVGTVLRLLKRERSLLGELEAKDRLIESQASQIERMQAANTELLRMNLTLSGISAD